MGTKSVSVHLSAVAHFNFAPHHEIGLAGKKKGEKMTIVDAIIYSRGLK